MASFFLLLNYIFSARIFCHPRGKDKAVKACALGGPRHFINKLIKQKTFGQKPTRSCCHQIMSKKCLTHERRSALVKCAYRKSFQNVIFLIENCVLTFFILEKDAFFSRKRAESKIPPCLLKYLCDSSATLRRKSCISYVSICLFECNAVLLLHTFCLLYGNRTWYHRKWDTFRYH